MLANIVSLTISPNFLRTMSLMISQMADKENMWISKQEWQEQGPRILEKLGPR